MIESLDCMKEYIVAEEITDWDYNHTYLLSKCKTKAHGYWKHHKEWTLFSKPIRFDNPKRKFKYEKTG